MKRSTPAAFAATTIGSKQSRLIVVLSASSSSKLASLEMQARSMTMSTPLSASLTASMSRMSPLISRKFGSLFGMALSPKKQVSKAVTL